MCWMGVCDVVPCRCIQDGRDYNWFKHLTRLEIVQTGAGGVPYPPPPCRFCLHAKLCFVGMHDLELGWGIIRGNPWEKNRTGGTRQRQLLERGVRAMRARLHSWYDRNPARTRVGNLTVGMVLGTKGTIYRPCLRAKGAESRTLAFFARDELQCWVHTIDTTEARL